MGLISEVALGLGFLGSLIALHGHGQVPTDPSSYLCLDHVARIYYFLNSIKKQKALQMKT